MGLTMKKVNILMSIYKPNLNFLIKQLQSINNQTYQNIEVLINDDCPDSPCEISVFKKYLTKVSYKILSQDDHNLGYIKSFEKLLKNSDGDYIAFCDQDDIWFSNKIEKSISVLEEKNALLVASDRQIIDENDNVVSESVRKKSNKIQENWHTGDDIAKYNLFITFAVGMVIVMKGEYARSTLPFSRYTGHDKWVISCAATDGKVAFIEEPLVQYRRHGHNVSGVLVGIESKKDYMDQRVIPDSNAIYDFLVKYPNFKDKKEVLAFSNARMNHSIVQLFRYRYLAPDIASFDIVISLTPGFMFPFLLKIARKFG
ncbi:MAG: glycosyltransferase [Absicoccus porci]|nr:glycosyltransferase [Absicoccus porci]